MFLTYEDDEEQLNAEEQLEDEESGIDGALDDVLDDVLDDARDRFRNGNNTSGGTTQGTAKASQDTAKASQKAAKEAQKAAKQAAKKAAKEAAKKSASKALKSNPYFWIAVLIIVIIICIIGIIGFFTISTGLIKTKLTSFAKGCWATVTGGSTWIDNDQVSEVKDFVSGMGYDLVGFGFVKDEKNAEKDGDTFPKDDNDKYIKSYIRAEMLSFMFEGDHDVYENFVSSLSSLFETSNTGMIVFPGKKGMSKGKITSSGTVSGESFTTTKQENTGIIGAASQILTGDILNITHISDSIEQFFMTSSEDGVNYTATISEGSNGNLALKISTKESIFSKRNVREYDLTEWTEQYGLPVYYLLALHIGTMSPDFAFNIATYIEPKVYFDVYSTKVTTEITGKTKDKCKDCSWKKENSVTKNGETYYVWTCSKCGVSCTMPESTYISIKESTPDIKEKEIIDQASIVPGTNGEYKTTKEYYTAIPYIDRINTWYAKKKYVYEFNNSPTTVEYEIEKPQEIDKKLETATAKDTIGNSISLKKVVSVDNSGLFKAFLTGNPAYLIDGKASGKAQNINGVDFYSESTYDAYFATGDYVEKNCEKCEFNKVLLNDYSGLDEDIKRKIYNMESVSNSLGYDPKTDNVKIEVCTCVNCNKQVLRYGNKECSMPEDYAIERVYEPGSTDTINKELRDAVLSELKTIAKNGGYLQYFGTVMDDSNRKYSPIGITSTMQQALEIIEETKGSGSQTIARELKKILADTDTIKFVPDETYVATSLTEAKMDTFDFILPNYFPSSWPTDAEVAEDYTKIISKDGETDGFKVGDPVIMPADGKLTVKDGKVILTFTEQNSYGMKMTISGIKPDESLNGKNVTRGEEIGTTKSNEIVLSLLDKDNEVLKVFEYMDAVYIRNDSVISAGLFYPVFRQKDDPWGNTNFYKRNITDSSDNSNSSGIKTKEGLSPVDPTEADLAILTNKSYKEVGSRKHCSCNCSYWFNKTKNYTKHNFS